MKNFFAKTLLITIGFLSFYQAQASDSVWVRAEGSGWGSPESYACRDAERDAEWNLDRECRYHADGNYYTMHNVNYSRCDCYESGSDNFRCRTRGEALCQIWD